jgi:crotonobetainyl-CoA:carnitine CoA-transferase CaiB-like acyl-CoA transferase
MMDGVFSWLSIHAGEFVATGQVPERERMHLSGLYPCYRVYPASDGWVSVGALEPQFWAALCGALDREDLLGDAFAMGERRDEVIAELEALFSTRSRSEWLEHFEGLDVCVGPVNDFSEAFADPQVRHRNMVVDAPVPGSGDFKHVGNPIKLAGAPGDVLRRPPPALGEHTSEMLEELGMGAEDIDELRAAGAI